MNTQKISLAIVGFGILISGLIFSVSFAETTVDLNKDIQYPVAPLGNCRSKEACKAYCDKPANASDCIAFAEENNLMTSDEINNAKKFMDAGGKGPGGCTGRDSCESYCNDINHINECIAYAEKTGILPPEELAEAKQVQSAIERGVKPPPCKNKKECDVYCDDPGNMKVCIAFGEAAGFLKGKDLEDAKKMITAIEKGVTPLPCKGKDACDTYCSEPNNMEACMNFAAAAGFMSPQEAEESQKVLGAIRKGVKPPACKGKDECDKYCGEESHIEECIAFSVAAGFMSEKDAEMAKKTRGKGPGGCMGKDECDAFCGNPDNQETCFNFGKENGLISPEQLREMEGGKGEFPEGPRAGPGGCQNREECDSYCKENPDKCNKFEPSPGAVNPGGQMMPRQAGPDGCKTPEECKSFCESNPEACKNFGQRNIPQGVPPRDERPPSYRDIEPREIQPMMPIEGRKGEPGERREGDKTFREIREGMPLKEMMPPGSPLDLPPEGAPRMEPKPFNPPAPTSMLSEPINLSDQVMTEMMANVFLSL